MALQLGKSWSCDDGPILALIYTLLCKPMYARMATSEGLAPTPIQPGKEIGQA